MSAPVNVLEVMDREARVANAYRLESGADTLAADAAEDAAEAIAAVAELIEAAEAYADAEAALANREIEGINAESIDRLQPRVHAARRDLDSALARVRGAA
ncbi:hypothetical protein [Stenotrophomonas sp.]|uniref:hypothetical protein n=1 Tax=Stenotrophomonas sp. TaxID=69392 RepID=UPI00289EBA1D|nr:hypothetical protein [Stenotrophomonas sp.]